MYIMHRNGLPRTPGPPYNMHNVDYQGYEYPPYSENAGYGYDWDQGAVKPVKVPTTFKGKLHRFAQTTSLQGIPFINRASRWYAKTIWSVLFLAALGALCFHLYTIFNKYYSARTTSSVTIGYSALDFPSVTLCNVNPIRKSALKNTSLAFQKFYFSLPGSKHKGKGGKGKGPDENIPDVIVDKALPVDNMTMINTDDLTLIEEDSEAFGYGEISETEKRLQLYTEAIGRVNQKTRNAIGHQKEMMIIDCDFNGLKCTPDNFTQIWIREYGNCYTFNSHRLRRKSVKARRSGTQFGLRMVVYLEDYEIVNGLNDNRGARLDIHQYNTMAFPVETGLSLSPGYESFVAIRMINATHLEDPFYGGCGDDGSFNKVFPFHYTVESCINTCLDRTIADKCDCRRPAFPYYYNLQQRQSLQRCQDKKQRQCKTRHHQRVMEGKIPCTCPEACNSITYDIVNSANDWPPRTLWNYLKDRVCNVSEAGCNEMSQVHNHAGAQQHYLSRNFVAVNVYYRDLNYQSIVEQPEYDIYQFLSDIGGVIGLWVGASVLTLAEIIDLITQICLLCKRKSRDKNPTPSQATPVKERSYPAHPNQGSPVISGLPRQNKYGVEYVRNPYFYN